MQKRKQNILMNILIPNIPDGREAKTTAAIRRFDKWMLSWKKITQSNKTFGEDNWPKEKSNKYSMNCQQAIAKGQCKISD